MRRVFNKEYIYNFILASFFLALMIITLNVATRPSSEVSDAKVVYATATDATDTPQSDGQGGTLQPTSEQGSTEQGSTEQGSTQEGSTEQGTTEIESGAEVDDNLKNDTNEVKIESNSTQNKTEGDGSEKEDTISNAEAAYANATSGISAAELAELTNAYSNTLKEKNELSATLNSIMESQNDFISRLHDLDDMIIEYQDKIEELNVKIDEGYNLLYEMQVSVNEAEEKQNQQYEIVKAHIKEEYENGKYTYLDALFSAVDYIDIVNKAEYIQSIEAYDKGLLDDYTSEKQTLVDKRALLMAVTSDMDVLEGAYQDKQDSLEILSAEKEKQINSYQESIDNLKTSIEYLESKEAEQSARIASLEASSSVTFTISGDSSYTYNGEQFVWPMPTSTYITSNFGYRTAPTAGATSYHRGIDIACTLGSEVKVAASGVVIYTGYLGSAGNAVVVDHGSGISTCYYHLSSFACSVGDSVTAGQTICYSGNTGVSTGPHLHFAVRENGEYVNPLNYFSTIADDQNVSNTEGN